MIAASPEADNNRDNRLVAQEDRPANCELEQRSEEHHSEFNNDDEEAANGNNDHSGENSIDRDFGKSSLLPSESSDLEQRAESSIEKGRAELATLPLHFRSFTERTSPIFSGAYCITTTSSKQSFEKISAPTVNLTIVTDEDDEDDRDKDCQKIVFIHNDDGPALVIEKSFVEENDNERRNAAVCEEESENGLSGDREKQKPVELEQQDDKELDLDSEYFSDPDFHDERPGKKSLLELKAEQRSRRERLKRQRSEAATSSSNADCDSGRKDFKFMDATRSKSSPCLNQNDNNDQIEDVIQVDSNKSSLEVTEESGAPAIVSADERSCSPFNQLKVDTNELEKERSEVSADTSTGNLIIDATDQSNSAGFSVSLHEEPIREELEQENLNQSVSCKDNDHDDSTVNDLGGTTLNDGSESNGPKSEPIEDLNQAECNSACTVTTTTITTATFTVASEAGADSMHSQSIGVSEKKDVTQQVAPVIYEDEDGTRASESDVSDDDVQTNDQDDSQGKEVFVADEDENEDDETDFHKDEAVSSPAECQQSAQSRQKSSSLDNIRSEVLDILSEPIRNTTEEFAEQPTIDLVNSYCNGLSELIKSDALRQIEMQASKHEEESEPVANESQCIVLSSNLNRASSLSGLESRIELSSKIRRIQVDERRISEEEIDCSCLATSTKKIYASSMYFDDKQDSFPTIEQQVEQCRSIARCLETKVDEHTLANEIFSHKLSGIEEESNDERTTTTDDDKIEVEGDDYVEVASAAQGCSHTRSDSQQQNKERVSLIFKCRRDRMSQFTVENSIEENEIASEKAGSGGAVKLPATTLSKFSCEGQPSFEMETTSCNELTLLREHTSSVPDRELSGCFKSINQETNYSASADLSIDSTEEATEGALTDTEYEAPRVRRRATPTRATTVPFSERKRRPVEIGGADTLEKRTTTSQHKYKPFLDSRTLKNIERLRHWTPYEEFNEHNSVSPEICLKLVQDLRQSSSPSELVADNNVVQPQSKAFGLSLSKSESMSKGARLFERRQLQSSDWIVGSNETKADTIDRQQPPKVLSAEYDGKVSLDNHDDDKKLSKSSAADDDGLLRRALNQQTVHLPKPSLSEETTVVANTTDESNSGSEVQVLELKPVTVVAGQSYCIKPQLDLATVTKTPSFSVSSRRVIECDSPDLLSSYDGEGTSIQEGDSDVTDDFHFITHSALHSQQTPVRPVRHYVSQIDLKQATRSTAMEQQHQQPLQPTQAEAISSSLPYITTVARVRPQSRLNELHQSRLVEWRRPVMAPTWVSNDGINTLGSESGDSLAAPSADDEDYSVVSYTQRVPTKMEDYYTSYRARTGSTSSNRQRCSSESTDFRRAGADSPFFKFRGEPNNNNRQQQTNTLQACWGSSVLCLRDSYENLLKETLSGPSANLHRCYRYPFAEQDKRRSQRRSSCLVRNGALTASARLVCSTPISTHSARPHSIAGTGSSNREHSLGAYDYSMASYSVANHHREQQSICSSHYCLPEDVEGRKNYIQSQHDAHNLPYYTSHHHHQQLKQHQWRQPFGNRSSAESSLTSKRPCSARCFEVPHTCHASRLISQKEPGTFYEGRNFVNEQQTSRAGAAAAATLEYHHANGSLIAGRARQQLERATEPVAVTNATTSNGIGYGSTWSFAGRNSVRSAKGGVLFAGSSSGREPGEGQSQVVVGAACDVPTQTAWPMAAAAKIVQCDSDKVPYGIGKDGDEMSSRTAEAVTCASRGRHCFRYQPLIRPKQVACSATGNQNRSLSSRAPAASSHCSQANFFNDYPTNSNNNNHVAAATSDNWSRQQQRSMESSTELAKVVGGLHVTRPPALQFESRGGACNSNAATGSLAPSPPQSLSRRTTCLRISSTGMRACNALADELRSSLEEKETASSSFADNISYQPEVCSHSSQNSARVCSLRVCIKLPQNQHKIIIYRRPRVTFATTVDR